MIFQHEEDVHFMQALNFPMATSSGMSSSEEFYLFKDNWHLKKKIYKYQKLWRNEVTNLRAIIWILLVKLYVINEPTKQQIFWLF